MELDTLNNTGAGAWGGQCTCPNGNVYDVGDDNNSCGSIACTGGVSSECREGGIGGAAAGFSVTCGTIPANPSPYGTSYWTADHDGSVDAAGAVHAVGKTLAECKASCTDSTAWPGCVGFSRYLSVPDAVPSDCWWVSSTNALLANDPDDDEVLYVHRTTVPAEEV